MRSRFSFAPAAPLAFAAALALAGCATTTPAPSLPAGSGVTVPLELGGRFAMTYLQSLPEQREAANGRFTLFQDRDRLTVDLISPFGQTLARAEQQRGRPAQLQTADNRTLTGPTLDDVFQRAIGIRVPASKLPDWLSNRFERVVETSADGNRVKATDSGWDIERNGGRWDLVWHQGTQRIEVRLVLDAP
ncbi:MAG: lipoprotein insertase outer membrane protein LolB [Lautropia sp.]